MRVGCVSGACRFLPGENVRIVAVRRVEGRGGWLAGSECGGAGRGGGQVHTHCQSPIDMLWYLCYDGISE